MRVAEAVAVAGGVPMDDMRRLASSCMSVCMYACTADCAAACWAACPLAGAVELVMALSHVWNAADAAWSSAVCCAAG